MDVSVQLLAQGPMDQGAQRAVGSVSNPTVAPAASTGTGHVQNFSQAFPSGANKVQPGGMTELVDRIRTDFEAFRDRLNPSADASAVRTTSGLSPAEHMEKVMDQSLRTQVDIFELSISFNAGLTATQQSQSGVKTLVEKT